MPEGIRKEIESLMETFWWVSRIGERKLHWMSTPLSRSKIEDKLIWKWEKNGEYSMKSSYYQLLTLNDSKNDGSSNPNLASLWKDLVNVCIRNLLWRFGQNILPLRSKLLNQGVQFDPSCPFCFEFPETLDHVFLHCSFAKMVWFRSPLGLRIMPDIDPLVWLEKSLSSKDTYGIQPFCTILWNF
ncbi:hypothetical protein KIW84_024866 [Lathyrus oleraceus]|uniref:Reverse transcriptase zinc-binding domain-containing protein n=1 Tax=Pisum sativum TaxID=3888 RepID=A0A9D4YIR8_PEA|nr:hypothetical protein KIW84_024866 [Pisum sativum]